MSRATGNDNVSNRPDVKEKLRQAKLNPEKYRKEKADRLAKEREEYLTRLNIASLIPDDFAKINKVEFKDFYYKSNASYSKIMNKRCPAITKHINENYHGDSLAEKTYRFVNDITADPACTNCGKPTPFLDRNRGFQLQCGHRCGSEATSSKAKEKWITNWLPKRIESFKDIAIPLFDLKDYTNVENKHPYQCVVCKNRFEDHIDDGHIPRCPVCYTTRYSTPQNEIKEYIESLDITNIEYDTRKIITPYEIDIYIPDKNIGIEYHSLFWHSHNTTESAEERSRHAKKSDLCDLKGVRLIQIFEHEWENKKEIVKSRLASILGKNSTIGGRETNISELTSEESSEFLTNNHLQGKDNSSIRLGLKHNDQLVAVMTFGRPRFNNNYEWELIRYCTILNTNVLGGANKLMQHFIKQYNPKSIISYADRRWSDGGLYKKLGFTQTNTSSPNYFYFKGNGNHIVSRIKAQKSNQPAFLSKFDINLTEHENMFNNGYRRIHDAGNLVFTLLLLDFSPQT